MKIVTILTLQDKIKEAEDEMEELKKGMEEVEKKMEKVENEEEALTKKIVNLFGEHQRKFNVDKLKEEFRNKIEKIFRSKINAPYFDLDFELNEISKEIARDKEKVDEYNTLKDRYNALKDEYDTLEDRYNILKSWITEIEEEKKITEAMEKTEALISEYVEINTDFDTLYHAFHKNN
jgi:predicted  nucleic acid-binding Zn-ribbon protein